MFNENCNVDDEDVDASLKSLQPNLVEFSDWTETEPTNGMASVNAKSKHPLFEFPP